MQGNNKFIVYSSGATNVYTDTEIENEPSYVTNGAPQGSVASSTLYNTLSKATSLVCTSLVDIIANQNSGTNFGVDTPLDTWISAVYNTFATKASVDTLRTNTETSLTNVVNGTTPVQIALYASSDTSKGTIEERLTRLGFNQGDITFYATPIGDNVTGSATNITTNSFKRKGNYVLVSLSFEFYYRNTSSISNPINAIIGKLPDTFYPQTSLEFDFEFTGGPGTITFETNGDVTLSSTEGFASSTLNLTNFGYEAIALE